MEQKIDLSNITAALFDLDGTLIDSISVIEEIYADIVRHLGKKFDRPFQSVWEEFTANYTPNETPLYVTWAEYLIKIFCIEKAVPEDIWRNSRTRVFEAYKTIAYKPGAAEVLKFLKGKNIHLAIVTSSSDRHIEVLVQNEKINAAAPIIETFEHAVTPNMTEMRKPHADPYMKAMELMGVWADNVIVFEDSLEGIKSAKAAGINNIVAIYDHHNDMNREKITQLARWNFKTWGDVLRAFEFSKSDSNFNNQPEDPINSGYL